MVVAAEIALGVPWLSVAAGASADPALEIPGKGELVSIEISMATAEGDAQGIALDADGWLHTWDEVVSGFRADNPERDRRARIPADLVAALIPLLARDGALSAGSGDTGPAQYREIRRVVTTRGTWALADHGAGSEVERGLRRLRFYVTGLGQLEWVETQTREATLRLGADGVLVASPRDGAPVRAWQLGGWEVHGLRDLLERPAGDGPSAAVVRTHTGTQPVADGGGVDAYVAALHERELGLELDGGARFQELRVSVECHGMLVYRVRVDADGAVTVSVGVPERSPFALPAGRVDARLPPRAVHALVRFLSSRPVRALAQSDGYARAPLADGAQMEVTLGASARVERRDPDVPVPVEVYDTGFFGGSRYLLDPDRLVEARLVRLVAEALGR